MGMMENKVETTVLYWGYIGMMEKDNGNWYVHASNPA